jgi:hypothetical protein
MLGSFLALFYSFTLLPGVLTLEQLCAMLYSFCTLNGKYERKTQKVKNACCHQSIPIKIK